MKKLIPAVLVIGLAALAIWKLRFGKSEDPRLIRLTGNIELTEVDLAFKSAAASANCWCRRARM